jgi:phosphodiesterase/alkaline phosphatase D-like protein
MKLKRLTAALMAACASIGIFFVAQSVATPNKDSRPITDQEWQFDRNKMRSPFIFYREGRFDSRGPLAETFPSGVASGDVTQDSVVLWARSSVPGAVKFEVFERKSRSGYFRRNSKNGIYRRVSVKVADTIDADEPVKVEIAKLKPGKQYLYRVRNAIGASATGHFRTPQKENKNRGLTFGVTGDWRGELAPYPAISNAAEADLDFFVLHGDTIYADFASPLLPIPQATTLDDFRIKHQEVYEAGEMATGWDALRASTAVFATIDDHEVTNDFAGGGIIGETAEDEFRELFPADDRNAFVNDSTLYENGLQAFQEYNPLRDEFYGDTGDSRTAFERKLFRNQRFGKDAVTIILDQRSFRDEQIAGVSDPTNVDELVRFQLQSYDASRTMLGRAQVEDLKEALLDAEEDGVTWKFVYTPEPIQNLGLNNADSWEGYQAERTEILKFIDEEEIDNVVFVAADIHATFINNLTYSESPLGEQIGTSTFEITTGSVAFDPPFGPAVIEVAVALGLIDEIALAFYLSLPIAPDNDGLPNDKDDFVTAAFNDLTIEPAGLDPLGLDNNLPQADGLIDAELLAGGWVSAHTFGWTQFDIDRRTQELKVTTYGIDGFTEEEIMSSPEVIQDLEPRIVSQFVVKPK